MDDTKQFLTAEKKAELEAELADLKGPKRKIIIDTLEFAKSLGDLSENAEYHQAREEQGRLEERIGRLEEILRTSVVVEKHHSTIVEVGSTISAQKKGDKETKTFMIVGSEEADTAAGKISNNSPLGQALLGHKKGDTATFNTPKGMITYTILDIK